MDKFFLKAEDVHEILGCSVPYAYKIIRDLNAELKANGFMTMQGRVERRFLFKRYGLDGDSMQSLITPGIDS